MNEEKWFEVYDNVTALASALNDDWRFETPTDMLRYFEKPWKWTPEWEAWTAAGKPTAFSFDKAAE